MRCVITVVWYLVAEVRFIEKLVNKTVVEGDKVVLETVVENPHKRSVKWFRNGVEIVDARYVIKSGSILDMVDRSVEGSPPLLGVYLYEHS